MSQTKTALLKAPSLNDGHDDATAKELLSRFRETQKAGRRIMSFGLFAWEIKEVRLKHGQWGPWLAAHCPELSRPDTKTGKPKPSSSLTTYMDMAKGVLEDMGFTIEKYFKHISNSQQLGICRGGKFLLLPDKRLPDPALKLKTEFCDRVDGKTAKQIRLTFNQVEEDESGAQKVKRGRLKGQGGASAEQRATAQAAEEAARIEALELALDQLSNAISEMCDDKHLGDPALHDATFNKFQDAVDFAHAYSKTIRTARKGAAAK